MNHSYASKKLLAVVYAAALLAVVMMFLTFGAVRAEGEPIKIVATTTMLADLIDRIGADHVDVSALMGPGVDPHLYQAGAGAVAKLQNSDVVAYHGLHLEGKMGEVFESLDAQNHKTICLEDGIEKADLLSDENNPEIYDPHIWFDVSLWKQAAVHVAAALAGLDEANAAEYEANLETYLKELDELEAYIKARVQELPEDQRVLITAHDAFRYFGRAYGIEVRGLQGISTDAEASTSAVSDLATLIAAKKIRAIFIESSVPVKNVEALQDAVKARGFDVVIGGQLYSDALGDAGTDAGTYIGMVRANVDTIVNALKGGM